MVKKCLVLFILILSFFSSSFGQTDSSVAKSLSDTIFAETTDPGQDEGSYYVLTPKEFWLSVALLSILFLVILVEVWLIKFRKISEELSIKLILVSIVLFGALFLITSGYDDQQVAPVFALFGTICGYLLGKSNNEKNSKGDSTLNKIEP